MIIQEFIVKIDVNSIEANPSNNSLPSFDYNREVLNGIVYKYKYIYPILECIHCKKISSTSPLSLGLSFGQFAFFICKHCMKRNPLSQDLLFETIENGILRQAQHDKWTREFEDCINCK